MKDLLLKIFYFLFGFPIIFRNIVINLVFNLIDFFKNRIFKRKNLEFLRMNNGRNFFCYKNKESAEIFIKNNIEPIIFDKVVFVNLNDPEIESKYESSILKILKNNNKFPCLIKICDDNIFRKSRFDELYKAMFIIKSNEEIIQDIIDFFDIIMTKPSRQDLPLNT